MKRVFFLSSAIVIVLSAFSQQVTRQEAVNAAVNTMKYNGRTSLAKSSIISIQSKNNGDTVLIESGRTITTDVVPPLLTTEWGQSYSNDWWDCNTYNYYVSATHDSCDCDIHQKCPAGCVATSMAQIMKYWNYPVWIPNKVEQYDWCNFGIRGARGSFVTGRFSCRSGQ
jgi:hypothetical protein